MGCVPCCEWEPQATAPPSGTHRIVGQTKGKALSADLEVAITDFKALLQEISEKEDTLFVLNGQLQEKKGGPAPVREDIVKPREMPDFSKMSLQQVEAEQAILEKHMQALTDREQALEKELLQSSEVFRRSISKAKAVGSLAKAATSARSGSGRLVPEEHDLLRDSDCLIGQDYDFGMQWDRRWQGMPMGPRDENLRRKVREGTKIKVAHEMGLRHFGEFAGDATKPQVAGDIHMFLDRTPASRIGSAAAAGNAYLLGRYDVVVVKTCADLDRTWNFIKGAKADFWVAHAAALNVGESTKASDFADFRRLGNGQEMPEPSLDEEMYYEAMEHIVGNVLHACATLKVEHLVLFPFGMGAFLRHLGQLDRRFAAHEELQRLRRRLARSLVRVIARSEPASLRVHLCLMFSEEEAQFNADAFIRALADEEGDEADRESLAKLRARLTIHSEGDSLQVAHELAVRSPQVLLLNGANRALLGNHWFAGRAKMAIDENLHRRSWRLSATSYLLNGFDGRDPEGRDPEELSRNVAWLGGTVHKIERSGQWL